MMLHDIVTVTVTWVFCIKIVISCYGILFFLFLEQVKKEKQDKKSLSEK